MNRRHTLHALLATPLLTALAGCGFQLRGNQSYPFGSILVTGPSAVPSLLMLELQRQLSDAPNMQVHLDRARGQAAQVRLDILQELREKVAVGLSVAGQVREFELRLRVKFRVRGAKERELIEDTELRLAQSFTYNENSALAKELEEAQAYRDMQAQLAAQMLRRLAALSGL